MENNYTYGVNEKIINFDKDTFHKTAKKLQKNITSVKMLDFNNEEKTSLTKIQDLLAKSLGFRNTDSLYSYFNANNHLVIKNNNNLFNLSSAEILQLFSLLMEDSGGDMWKGRAMSLISAIIMALTFMRDNKEILLNVDIIREYLILNNVTQLYKTRRDFPIHIRTALKTYLLSIPGFQESINKQNATVLEQHGYLQMQLIRSLDLLKKIENDDCIIISPSWYHAVFTNHDKSIKTYTRLNDSNLDELYSKISNEEWNDYFNKNNPDISYGSKVEYNSIKPKNDKFTFKGIELINPIVNNSYLEDSWLEDKQFKRVLHSIIKNKQFKTFYFSDLFFYSTKVVNSEKRSIYNLLLFNLLNNYNTVIEYSHILNNLSK